MQNYYGNSSENMRRGNTGRNSRMSCSNVISAPCSVSEKEKALAMAYVPWQTWGNLMCPEKALQTGTIFAELNKPFYGMGACRS